jgi:hypothetical protein
MVQLHICFGPQLNINNEERKPIRPIQFQSYLIFFDLPSGVYFKAQLKINMASKVSGQLKSN